MPRLSFGAFLAPHHPIGEHPMLQFRRDLDLVEHLDKLGTTNSGAASIIPAAGR
jgi:limonene 1,2-monooxygenase